MAKRKSKNFDSLLEEYNVLSMRADKRLQRIEKYSKRPGYEGLKQGAYARAIRDIEVWSGKGHKRFRTKPPTTREGMINETELQAKINDIRHFLRAETSTMKPGIDTRGFSISSYEKMAETTNKRYGGDFTWQELARFYESKKAERIAKSIKSSKSVARALGKFKKFNKNNPNVTGKELRDMIKNDTNFKFTDDQVTDDIMKRIVKLGLTPSKLFEGK